MKTLLKAILATVLVVLGAIAFAYQCSQGNLEKSIPKEETQEVTTPEATTPEETTENTLPDTGPRR